MVIKEYFCEDCESLYAVIYIGTVLVSIQTAAGSDGMPMQVLKAWADQLTEVLTVVFNISLAQAAVSTSFITTPK